MTGAAELKEQGNKYFVARKYSEAIASYSKAIVRKSKTISIINHDHL